MNRGIIDQENYKFYDEREWRFIPSFEELGKIPGILQANEYIKEREKFNLMVGTVSLAFNVDNVSYIIVDNDDEVPELINMLNTTFEDKCTAKQLKVLTTKIITKNQIFNDF